MFLFLKLEWALILQKGIKWPNAGSEGCKWIWIAYESLLEMKGLYNWIDFLFNQFSCQ